jgi:hypothetical protein
LCLYIRIVAVGVILGLVTVIAIVVIDLGFFLFFEELFSCRSYVTSSKWAVVCLGRFWSVDEIFVLVLYRLRSFACVAWTSPSPRAASISFDDGCRLVISLPFCHGRYLVVLRCLWYFFACD